MTRVVHIRHAHDVYIGRPSIWGNPWSLKREKDRDLVIAQYAAWIVQQPHLIERLAELKGKRLGCYCAPKRCHGDVLALLADGVPPDCLDLFISAAEPAA